MLRGGSVDSDRRREHDATNPTEATCLKRIHHPQRVDRHAGERILRHRERQVTCERKDAIHILHGFQQVWQTQHIPSYALNTSLLVQVSNR